MEVSLGVYPPLIRVRSNPDVVVKTPLMLLNNSENSLETEIIFKPIYDSGSLDGSVEYYPEKDIPQRDLDFIKSVKIMDGQQEIKNIKLYPKEYKNLNIEFKTPRDLSKDYYFSVLFSRSIQVESSDQTKSYIQPGVAINVLLSKHESKPFAIIEELRTDRIVFNGPLKLSLAIKNTSPSYETFSGKIMLYDIFGKAIDESELKSEVILAGASKSMYEKGAPQKIELGDRFMLGLYKAQIQIKSSENNLLSSKEISVLCIPLFVLVAVSVVLFIVLGLVYRVLRKINLRE